MKIKFLSVILALSMLSAVLSFGEETPVYTVIKGGTIIPVVGEKIPDGTIVIKDTLIHAVGLDVPAPEGAVIFDAKGKYVYPGMIDSSCVLGLQEISMVRSTVDYRETGRFNPQVKAVEAIWPESMHIPIARSNGITAVVLTPSGSFIGGQCGLIQLNGWIPNEMVVKESLAMMVSFPPLPRGRRGDQDRERPQTKKILEELKDIFEEARFYQKRKKASKENPALPPPDFDEKMENMLPVINGELPLYISVQSAADIKAAIELVKKEEIRAIFLGAHEAWKVAKEIKESGIPLVFGSLYELPVYWEDGYDALYRNPRVMHEAGILFAFSSESAASAKDLPYHAAKAAAFGLDKKEALKGVTINPARIFGVENLMGSLEKGKLANIVIADGDLLEFRTKIEKVFIAGKETDISTRYDELLKKYKKRYK
ncbi:MAG: amidohydrolase family protein [Candidatus Aminicenantes bacterium]|nr:amidohydrolase family protein [Candidatus Aminicenantes bacterium]